MRTYRNGILTHCKDATRWAGGLNGLLARKEAENAPASA